MSAAVTEKIARRRAAILPTYQGETAALRGTWDRIQQSINLSTMHKASSVRGSGLGPFLRRHLKNAIGVSARPQLGQPPRLRCSRGGSPGRGPLMHQTIKDSEFVDGRQVPLPVAHQRRRAIDKASHPHVTIPALDGACKAEPRPLGGLSAEGSAKESGSRIQVSVDQRGGADNRRV